MKNIEPETRPILALAGTLLLSLLSACTSVATNQDDVLAERAQARWDALLAKDYATAYSYYSPGFRARATATDLEIKVRMQRVKWTAARYVDKSCTDDACTVQIELNYRVDSPVPGVGAWNGTDLAREQWVKVGGEWWFVPPKDD